MVDVDGVCGRPMVSIRKIILLHQLTLFYDALDHEMADRLKGVMAIFNYKYERHAKLWWLGGRVEEFMVFG